MTSLTLCRKTTNSPKPRSTSTNTISSALKLAINISPTLSSSNSNRASILGDSPQAAQIKSNTILNIGSGRQGHLTRATNRKTYKTEQSKRLDNLEKQGDLFFVIRQKDDKWSHFTRLSGKIRIVPFIVESGIANGDLLVWN